MVSQTYQCRHIADHVLQQLARVVARDSSITSAGVQDLYVALCEDQTVWGFFKRMKGMFLFRRVYSNANGIQSRILSKRPSEMVIARNALHPDDLPHQTASDLIERLRLQVHLEIQAAVLEIQVSTPTLVADHSRLPRSMSIESPLITELSGRVSPEAYNAKYPP
jgi:hypothetical protein